MARSSQQRRRQMAAARAAVQAAHDPWDLPPDPTTSEARRVELATEPLRRAIRTSAPGE